MEASRIRVVVIDSNRMNGQAISAALKSQEFHIVYEGCDPAEAITEACRQRADVALIGEHIGGQAATGFELTKKIRGADGKPQPVMILDRSDHASVTRAFRAGARGIFCRSSSLETLYKCILCVSQGQVWASSADLEHLLQALKMPLQLVDASGAALLSNRERDVVEHVSEGLTNREIAKLLGLSENTVKNYIYRIFDKLGISSRVELVLYTASQFMQRYSQGEHCQNPFEASGDESQMFRWCSQAVERFTVFQYLLGELYREGKGVSPDAKAAYMWFRIAESVSETMKHRSRAAQLELERELTEQQLADATQQAADWVQKQQRGQNQGKRQLENPRVA
jgi:DNA-binding NarL/FixJ family response regulator